MHFKSNLQTKFLLFAVSTLLLVFVFIGLFIGSRNSKNAKKQAYEYTQLLAEKNANEIKSIFNQYFGFINASSKTFANAIQADNQNTASLTEKQLQTILAENINIEGAWILLSNNTLNNPDLPLGGWSLFQINRANSSSIQQVNDKSKIDEYLAMYGNTNSIAISEPYVSANKKLVEIYQPIQLGSKKVGYIGCSLNLTVIADLISKSSSYEDGSFGLISNSGIIAAHSNWNFVGRVYSQNFADANTKYDVTNKILKGSWFEMLEQSGRESYYSYFLPVYFIEKGTPWSVYNTVPMHDILKATNKSIKTSAGIALLGLILIVIVLYLTIKRIVQPIKKVTEVLGLLSEGNLKDIKTTEISASDELQEMAENLTHVVNGLKKTESFALEIGVGNLNNEYHLLSDADQLGKALIDMRNSLKKNIEEDIKRKKEEEQVAWAANGIAKFGEILRQDNANMKKLGYNILSNLINYLNVNQGALFVLNEDNADDTFFELATAIAFGRDKFMQRTIKVGEGLVGRCAFERKTIFLTEVPANYTTITSGLGDSKPGSILIVPCILNDEVYGIIELASFTPLKPFEIEFVEKLGESIGATISSVRINLKTATLLAASQTQSEELAAQEEELRQNLEEMEATQEDLKRQMLTNAEMQEDLTKQTALLDSLLNSLPDYIYFKDANSKFLRLSKSMIHLFGTNSVDDILGKSDFDFHTPENAKKYYDDEQNIIRTQKGFTDLLQKEIMRDGQIMWYSVTKLPLLTPDGQCFGTFGISKNVTEIKELEIEAQKQTTLLDSLLNSLPDYIYFKDKDSKFIRISKSMLNLFGANSVEEVIGKSDFDYHNVENAQQYFDDEQKIIKTKEGITNQLQKEKTADGITVWTIVTKLPLLTKEDDCVGTFGISRNVTQLKTLEIDSNKQKIELTGLIEAVKNSIYTVEYDLQGFIIDANEAMLELLKSDRESYIGKHYKEELTSKKVSDKEYQNFWNELVSGQIKYVQTSFVVNKKEVSLYETYSPIKDAENKVVKILKMALDITEYVKKK
jgi:PAS domain S-box-containing protein